jgi:hypothetical protein
MRWSGVLAVAALAAVGQAPSAAGAAAGWEHGSWAGIPPPRFEVAPGGRIAVSGEGQGGFLWRWEHRAAECLSWRWRVDEGPPPTRLDRRGGDDRALSVTIGFAGWPPQASVWQRAQHRVAQAGAGGRHLPRAALVFAWGGTGEEPRGFESPYMAGLGRVFVLRPATAPRGEWQEERVDLGALWREVFGGTPPPVEKIAIGADADDTGARLAARIENIRFAPCPRRL